MPDQGVCSCNPSTSLLSMGYFPSAPLQPTTAFDMKVLEFARELYLRSPPNRTAWSTAWESFLRGRGHIFSGPDYIRRKFTTAIRYYCLLQAETQAHARRAVLIVQAITAFGGDPTQDDGDEEWVDDEDFVASQYLAHTCSLCFGACAENDKQAP